MDIIRAPENIETMKETELILNSCTMRMVELQEQHAMKIISQFADVQFCLFAIDLTCYDRYLDNNERTNELQERLSYLKGICRSIYFSKSIILLIFTNAAAFKGRIAISPMKTHFKDYSGGNDVNAATKYVLKKCREVNKADLALFWHIHDCALDDSEAAAMNQFLRQSAASITAVSWLREFGLGAA
jgi:guanine nucleotide-binding protein G(i) subunit alpha